MPNVRRIVVCSGEPFGIGPDILCQIAHREFDGQLIVLADEQILAERAAKLDLDITFKPYNQDMIEKHQPGQLCIYDVKAKVHQSSTPHPDNAKYVLEMLNIAVKGCQSQQFDAMVTAPVNKAIINQAGKAFSGHTEYIANLTNTPRAVMMLVSGNFRVALATTHIPLAKVPSAITKATLENTISILHRDLRKRFSINNPCIAITGLNPHAGEQGYLGREEIETIIPVIEKLKANGIHIQGPYPADTIFIPQNLQKYDAILVMYHDQGLPVLKHSHFDTTVNITLGLPIIRTSVDHGTASDLVGTGKTNPESLWQAIILAAKLSEQC
jgi:4-hydroxythreonine-4-phosphate dehydrogenase